MMLQIREVLTRAQVAQCRDVLDAATWLDGGGGTSSAAPLRMQLPEDAPAARAVGDAIQDALACNAGFFAAALPSKVFPPHFERDAGGAGAGPRIDDAIRTLRGTGFRVRCDLSATLFLADPDDYDGGELCIDDTYGTHRAKLPAGDLLLYPASSVHRTAPVTRGVRVVSHLWVQSLIRDDTERGFLHQLDTDVQRLGADLGTNHAAVVSLTGLYHNLLRHWANG